MSTNSPTNRHSSTSTSTSDSSRHSNRTSSSPYANVDSPIASIARRSKNTNQDHSTIRTQDHDTTQDHDMTQDPDMTQEHDQNKSFHNRSTYSQDPSHGSFMSQRPHKRITLENFPKRAGSVILQQSGPVHGYMPPSLRSVLSVFNLRSADGKIMLLQLNSPDLHPDFSHLDIDDFEPFLFIKSLPNLSSVVPNPRKSPIPKKSAYTPPLTLALDLDETLVHCSIQPIPNPEFTFRVNFNNSDYEVYVKIRPHLEFFLKQVSQWFEVVVFTASQKVYADTLLNMIDPCNEYITHRVFRDSCVCHDGNYLKDLNILGRPLDKVVIVDNSYQAFGFQLDNGIPIESWFDDDSDAELLQLIPFLRHLKDVNDVRPYVRNTFRLGELVEQIELPDYRM